jgi:ribosome-binding factor A
VAGEHRRSERVAEAVRAEVATFLASDAKDPRLVGLITVTGVEVTRDLRRATVFVSVMGSDSQRDATLDGLASAATHLRSRIARALQLRVAPEIGFRLDETVQRAARIDALLNQVRGGAALPDDDSRDA